MLLMKDNGVRVIMAVSTAIETASSKLLACIATGYSRLCSVQPYIIVSQLDGGILCDFPEHIFGKEIYDLRPLLPWNTRRFQIKSHREGEFHLVF